MTFDNIWWRNMFFKNYICKISNFKIGLKILLQSKIPTSSYVFNSCTSFSWHFFGFQWNTDRQILTNSDFRFIDKLQMLSCACIKIYDFLTIALYGNLLLRRFHLCFVFLHKLVGNLQRPQLPFSLSPFNPYLFIHWNRQF